MTRFPRLIVVFVAGVGLLFASGGQATPGQSTTLHGRVGPGFSIVLTTESGARVTQLDPGTYEIDVEDLAEEHNFHLFGPGVDKATEIGDTGTVHWTVTFRDGTYTYQCDPHQGTMNGSFTVGNVPTQQPPPQKPPSGSGAVTPKTKLVLTSGPGFTITLKTTAGKTVKSMKTGTYTLVVRDRSSCRHERQAAACTLAAPRDGPRGRCATAVAARLGQPREGATAGRTQLLAAAAADNAAHGQDQV